MSWDNHRRQDSYFDEPKESTTWTYFKVGLGLMLGMGVAWVIYMFVVGTFVAGTVNQMQVQTTERINAQAEKVKFQALQLKEAAENAVNSEAREREEQQRLQREAAEAERRERLAKEAAWQKFYKKRPECENLTSNEVFVECGNEYMRAQRKFDQVWEARKQKVEVK
jgi:uncharacterized membrane protein YhiD involved in acid resistance